MAMLEERMELMRKYGLALEYWQLFGAFDGHGQEVIRGPRVKMLRYVKPRGFRCEQFVEEQRERVVAEMKTLGVCEVEATQKNQWSK